MTRISKYLILTVLFLQFLGAAGQSYNFINYGIGEGLAHDKITDICEDQFGNLWLGTAGGGLSKFNGEKFENFTIKNGLQSNYIRDILNDSKGNIWAATASGLSRLDGKSIKNFNIDTIEISNNSINVIYESSSGGIYFSAPNGGLGLIDESDSMKILRLKGMLSVDRIIDIDEDDQGNIWLVSAIKGLFRVENDSAKLMVDNSDLKGYILSVEPDINGNFWMGTNKGLFKLDTHKRSSNVVVESSDIFIKSVEVIDSNSIWLVTPTNALKKEHDKITSFSSDQGLTDKSINVIYKDREQNVWFGSDGDGLYKLSRESFLFYNANHGLTNLPVTSISKDNSGKYWFGSFGDGLSVYDGQNFQMINKEDGLKSEYITCSAVDHEGNVWLGTRGSGIYKFDGKSYINFTTKNGLVFDVTRQLFVDDKNNIWVGTINGLSIFDGNKFQNFTEENGLSDNVVWGLSASNNNDVLIVTRSGFQKYKNNALVDLLSDENIFKNRINTAIQDKFGQYWIGYSGHGILKINDSEEKVLTTSEGLGSDLIYSLTQDPSGNILVGTERGIDKIILDSAGNIESIKNYGQVEGFKNLQTTYGAILNEGNGRIWYGNDKGAILFDTNKEKKNQVEPKVYIADIRLVYSDADWLKNAEELINWTNIPKELEVKYSDNNLVFDYFATSLRNPGKVTYKYRLVGLEDDKWSNITSRTEAVYTNLSPGNYRFEVLAANSDGIWTSEPAVYEFNITPPFWLRWWFFLLVALLFIISLKAFNDYRIRVKLDKIMTVEKIRSEELQKVRKKMARDFHDNLGNQLASISVYVNLISLKLKEKSHEVDDLLKNIQKHTNSLFNGTKDFIWTMDPDSDELNEIYTYIKDFGEDLFENTNIEFYSHAKGLDGQAFHLPSGWSRQLVLIFKEGMTNVLKHANASEVHLELEVLPSSFEITLIDNGTGFHEDEIHNGIGLNSMKNRAKDINSALQFASDNKGTKIKFRAQELVINKRNGK